MLAATLLVKERHADRELRSELQLCRWALMEVPVHRPLLSHPRHHASPAAVVVAVVAVAIQMQGSVWVSVPV